ncbi:hypothetical protein RCL1_004411 [Eukaryota sp. TZLM3-RCL]
MQSSTEPNSAFLNVVGHLYDRQNALRQQIDSVLSGNQKTAVPSFPSTFCGKTTTQQPPTETHPKSSSSEIALDTDLLSEMPLKELQEECRPYESPVHRSFQFDDTPPQLVSKFLSPSTNLESLSIHSVEERIEALCDQIRDVLPYSQLEQEDVDEILLEVNKMSFEDSRGHLANLDYIYRSIATRISILDAYRDHEEITHSILVGESHVPFDRYYNDTLSLFSSLVVYERDYRQSIVIDGQNLLSKIEAISLNLNDNMGCDLLQSLSQLKTKFITQNSQKQVKSKRQISQETKKTPEKVFTQTSPKRKPTVSPSKSSPQWFTSVNPNKSQQPTAGVLNKYNKYDESPHWENTLRSYSKKTANDSVSPVKQITPRRTRPHKLENLPVSSVLENSEQRSVPVSVPKVRRVTVESALTTPTVYSSACSSSRHAVSVPMPTYSTGKQSDVEFDLQSIYPRNFDGKGGDFSAQLERIKLLKSLIPK